MGERRLDGYERPRGPPDVEQHPPPRTRAVTSGRDTLVVMTTGSGKSAIYQIVVATTAFGMGIDKPNVRYVLHHDPSESVDSYYQEIGRAGRDDEPADAILFYRTEDLGLRRFFAAGARDEARRAFNESRLEMMRRYAEHDHCRRSYILRYFGEQAPAECGNCDNCEAGRGRPDGGEQPFAVGASVAHDRWGPVVVQRYDGDQMTVLFETAGYKTLSVELVVEGDLLTTPA